MTQPLPARAAPQPWAVLRKEAQYHGFSPTSFHRQMDLRRTWGRAGREKQGCQAHSQEPRGLVPLWSQGQPYVLGRTSRRPTGAPEHSGIPLPHQSRRPLGPQTAEGAPGAFQPFLLRTAPIGETYSTRPAPVQPGEHRFKFWPTGSDAPK